MEVRNHVAFSRRTDDVNEDIRNFFKILGYIAWLAYVMALKVAFYRKSKSFEGMLRSFRILEEDLQAGKQIVHPSFARSQIELVFIIVAMLVVALEENLFAFLKLHLIQRPAYCSEILKILNQPCTSLKEGIVITGNPSYVRSLAPLSYWDD